MSRGAQMAGMDVKWGFDSNPHALNVYHRNFPDAVAHLASADQLQAFAEDLKVDILHMSPPCQVFSPAHTVPGRDDEINEASFLAMSDLTKLTKPRVVIVENTFGLFKRHPEFRNKAINCFTSLGYSVRMKVLKLQGFGVPQNRKRIILIASW
jgi:DNA (cytosine-5)-methyltransferase 1